MTRRLFFLFLLLVLPLASAVQPQAFGKNKVQYRGFDWQVVKTSHFDIYFYEGEEYLADFVSDVAETAYDRLEADFRVELSKNVPIVLYNSHNDFEQTNVITELLEESVGGFTEIFKDRVVLPFNGSYKDLERVTIHELTHALQFDILYGRGAGALISRVYQIQFPVWFAEGLAQFQSKEWDSESDMILRDLTLNDRIIPIQILENVYGSYLVYVEGESILRYINERYGREKIFELFHQLKTQRTMSGAIKATFGFGTSELDRQWQRWLKLRYWAGADEKQSLDHYGKRLTSHQEEGSVLNVTPRLSPDGTKIAYLSDRSGYSDLYIISSLDGSLLKHLVKGERSSGFESIHIHRGGIGWSPNGDEVVFIAKSHSQDIVYTMDINSSRVTRRLHFDLDGVYSPDWSPSGNEICFVGLKDGASDLYIYDLLEERVRRVTDDRYDERDPIFSPDGSLIAFASDRGDFAGEYAIFTVRSADGSGVAQRSLRSESASSPSWSHDGKLVAFIADLGGTPNLHVVDISQSTSAQATDVLTGITTAHWSGTKLVFSGFNEIGWDLFITKDPLELVDEMLPMEILPSSEESPVLYGQAQEAEDYGLKFSPDWMIGGVSYSSAYGISGQSQIALSDVLGNHRINLVTDLIQSIEESNFYLAYWYLPRRIDYGCAIFQQKYYYALADGGADIISEREYGTACFARHPFDRFRRVDLELDFYLRERTLYEYSQGLWWATGEERRLVLIPYLSLVYDNSRFGPTGPIDGVRYNITYGKSIPITSDAVRFDVLVGDGRKYYMLGDRHSIALRLVGAYTHGRDAEPFWIGGSENLRGFDDYSLSGDYVGFLNMELRTPFIDQFKLAFPLPLEIRYLRGVLFMDLGVACDAPKELVLTERGISGHRLRDLKMGFGAGIRLPMSFFILKLDFAKNTDLENISRKTYVHFSLGTDF